MFVIPPPPFIIHRHTSLHCTLLYCASQVLCFLQVEGKILRQQKDSNSFYCDTLLQWSGTEPAISPRHACIFLTTPAGPSGLPGEVTQTITRKVSTPKSTMSGCGY